MVCSIKYIIKSEREREGTADAVSLSLLLYKFLVIKFYKVTVWTSLNAWWLRTMYRCSSFYPRDYLVWIESSRSIVLSYMFELSHVIILVCDCLPITLGTLCHSNCYEVSALIRFFGKLSIKHQDWGNKLEFLFNSDVRISFQRGDMLTKQLENVESTSLLKQLDRNLEQRYFRLWRILLIIRC